MRTTGSPRPGLTTATTWGTRRASAATTGKRCAVSRPRPLIITAGELDLYNPVEQAQEAARYIPDSRFAAIPSGHVAASPAKAADVEFINRCARVFGRRDGWRSQTRVRLRIRKSLVARILLRRPHAEC